MRRDLRIVLGTLVLGATWLVVEHGRETLAGMTTFQVREVEVRGARFVERDEVVALLRLQPASSVWGDKAVWAERVARHPLVRSAAVSRRLPDGLVVTVIEREPVALAPGPTLEPVDVDGVRLPVDPAAHRLDLPIIATRAQPAPRARYAPREVRTLAAELGRLMSADTAFMQRVSDLSWDEDHVRVGWTEPSVDFLLPAGTPPARLREGIDALQDALTREARREPLEVDLRFADQVVVRRTPEQ